MTEATAKTHTDQDIDAPSGLVADPDTLAKQSLPDLQKLQDDVERTRSRVVARQVEGGDVTDAKRKARQAEEALREGQELATQIEAARAYIHQRDHRDAEREEQKRLSDVALQQAQRLEAAAERLEQAEQEVAEALKAADEPIKQHPALDAVSRRGLCDLVGQLNVDRQRQDLTPTGAPGRLRRTAATLRSHFDNSEANNNDAAVE